MPDLPDATRRRLLAALALAPAACATSRVAAPPGASSASQARVAVTLTAATDDPYRVLREHPLAEAAEPALWFRALRSPR
jgi:hypothetical protein